MDLQYPDVRCFSYDINYPEGVEYWWENKGHFQEQTGSGESSSGVEKFAILFSLYKKIYT